ncbi:MAG: cobalamin biosynthesis protein [Syntrophobacteraceae bacterium]|nr:cobalamin biosynthesis protein [Syntrophobacteraceae bacterium]
MTNPLVISIEMPKKPGREKTAIFALTRKGAELAERISRRMPGSPCFCLERYAQKPGMIAFARLSDAFGSAWREYDGLVCIMGCGIAVRMAAPLLAHKTCDPAVVVVDQNGAFAVSLLSGHLGGANELARKVADITGGRAVITTASDIQGKLAIDLAVKSAGLRIENLAMAARIQAAILDEEPLWIFDPDGLLLRYLPPDHGLQVVEAPGDSAAFSASPGIWVSELLAPMGGECLEVRPQNLVVGVGCNRGTSSEEIVGFIKEKLKQSGLSPQSIRNFASLDLKADERGLLEAVKVFDRPIYFCARRDIEDILVPNPSETVARHAGVKSVCEASALWSAGTRELLAPKRKAGNCTMAVARVSSR